MALKNFTQFTPQTVLSATDFLVGYRNLDEIRTDLSSLTDAISGLLLSKGFTPGGTFGSVTRLGYRFTIAPGNNLNAVSGTDDNGQFLLYNPGAVEVYRNGSHLVETLDYQATNGTQILNLSTMNVGDIVEISSLSGIPLTIIPAITGAGNALVASFRYTVNSGNTIVPNATLISGADDYNAVLNFIPANIDVYVNGSHLIRDIDYGLYSSGSSFTLNDAVTGGDVIDVITLSGTSLTPTIGISAYSNVTNVNRGKNILVSQSSGVVTISAKSDICSEISLDDIPVPGWTDGQHISRFSLLQDYLSAVATTNTSPASNVYVEYFGSSSGLAAHVNLVNLPNGKIYAMPHQTSFLRIIDPNTNTVSVVATITNPTSVNITHGGVLGSNGKVYTIPADDTVLRKIDPSNNTISIIATLGTSSYQTSSQGGVLGPNGKIYIIPLISTFLRMIDPNNDTVTVIATITPGTQYQSANCLAPNGKIYLFPGTTNGTMIRVIDPSNNQISSLGFVCPKTSSAILAPNGKIYLAASLANARPLVFDPQTETISTFAVISFSTNIVPNQACLLPNGKIFSYNGFGGNSMIMILDPDTNTATTFSTAPYNSIDSYGLIAGPNGNVYLAPYGSTNFVSFNFLNNNNWNINVATNPFFNKT